MVLQSKGYLQDLTDCSIDELHELDFALTVALEKLSSQATGRRLTLARMHWVVLTAIEAYSLHGKTT